jgi:hypothetical protein
MNQPENQPEIPATPTAPSPQVSQVTVGTAPQVQVEHIKQAMEQMERKKNRGKVTRRVLLGVVGVGVCAGAIEAAPFIVEQAGYHTQQELDKALQSGIAQGREELLAELRNLEGIGLDTAIAIAQLTKFGVQYIVKPLADLSSTIQGDIIGALASGVAEAIAILVSIPAVVPGRSGALSALGNLEKLLITWRTNVTQDQLAKYALQDVTAAEAYLEALQAKINGQKAKGS